MDVAADLELRYYLEEEALCHCHMWDPYVTGAKPNDYLIYTNNPGEKIHPLLMRF